MTVAREREDKKKSEQPDLVVATPEYQDPAVDTSKVPISSLTTYLPGMAWEVDWYRQRLGKNAEVKALQLDISPVHQNYDLIKGFELKLTGDVSSSQDTNSREMMQSGEANVYSLLKPNIGDMFTADIGNGLSGLYTVTSSERLNLYPTSAHVIQFSLVGELNDAYREDLRKKTVDVRVFDLNHFRSGYNPLLTEEHVSLRNQLRKQYRRLVDVFFHDFFSNEMSTLLVPNQRLITYDPFAVRFVLNVISTEDHPDIKRVRALNVSGDRATYEFTLWNAIELADIELLRVALQKVGLVPTKAFSWNRFTQGIYHSRAERVVYPLMRDTNVDQGYFRPTKKPSDSKLIRGWARFAEFDRLVPVTEAIGDRLDAPVVDEVLEPAPFIHRVTKDEYYVFTKAFYRHEHPKDAEGISVLERLTLQTLKGQPIDVRALNSLCTDSLRWDNLERFYYVPILLWLIRLTPRSLR